MVPRDIALAISFSFLVTMTLNLFVSLEPMGLRHVQDSMTCSGILAFHIYNYLVLRMIIAFYFIIFFVGGISRERRDPTQRIGFGGGCHSVCDGFGGGCRFSI